MLSILKCCLLIGCKTGEGFQKAWPGVRVSPWLPPMPAEKVEPSSFVVKFIDLVMFVSLMLCPLAGFES